MEIALHRIIRDDFKERQHRHPKFSLRSYARFLGVNPTSLSLFINGKRNLSQDSILKILDKLELSVLGQKKGEVRSAEFEEISIDAYCRMSDWYYFAILSLMETDEFRSDSHWIASRLGLDVETVESALATMHQLGVIRFKAERELEATGRQYKTPDELRSFVKKRSHLQALDLAIKSVQEDDAAVTDFSAMTMAISLEKLPKARQRIMEFRREMCQFLEDGKKEQVYRMSIQLFPLTKSIT